MTPEEDFESYDLWGAPDRCIYCGISPSQYLVYEVREQGVVTYGKVLRHCGSHSLLETQLPAGTRSVHANDLHHKFQAMFDAARRAEYLTVTTFDGRSGYRIQNGSGFTDAEVAWMDDCRRASRPVVILRTRLGRDSTIAWPSRPYVAPGHDGVGRQIVMDLATRLSPSASGRLSPYDYALIGDMQLTDVAKRNGETLAADVVRTLAVLRDPDLIVISSVLDT